MIERAALCEWLHRILEALPLVSYPFEMTALPRNGVYFFYETGERCGHPEAKQRIIRVGTHRDGNFRSLIAEHFLLDERKMAFTADKPAPHDRSIFRKHIGRALLNRLSDPYREMAYGRESDARRTLSRELLEGFGFSFHKDRIPDRICCGLFWKMSTRNYQQTVGSH
jgi:hypothetical protein